MANGIIFNQNNMNMAVSNINSALDEVCGAITRESANFISYLSVNWECQYAVNFVTGSYTEHTSFAIGKLKNNVGVAYEMLDHAKNEYHNATGNDLNVPAITYNPPTIDVSPIQVQFPNGDVGIRAGFTAQDAMKAIDALAQSINSRFEDLKNTITNCGALSDDEMSVYANKLYQIGSLLSDGDIQNLKQEANSLISQTTTEFEAIQSANISDMEGR